MADPERDLLRHTLATVAYRGAKPLKSAPAGFGDFASLPGTRTPVQILAHVNDVLDWARGLADGRHEWSEPKPGPWEQEVARFFRGLQLLDDRLSSERPLGFPAEKLFQGPIADVLTHIGQLAMLRRMAGGPVKGENYFKAEIVAGRLSPEQAEARREFD